MAHITKIYRRDTGVIDYYDGETIIKSTEYIVDCNIVGNEIVSTLSDGTTISYTVEDFLFFRIQDDVYYNCSPVALGSPEYTARINDIAMWCMEHVPKYPTTAYVQQLIDDIPPGSATWGGITGDI